MRIDPGYKPVLKEGMYDLAVRAAQGAARRALAAKGIEAHNKGNGAYGSLTKNDINRLEHAYGIRPVTGARIEALTWEVLTPYLSQSNKRWLSRRRRQFIALNLKEQARRAALAAKMREPRRRLERESERVWNNRHHLTYSMTRSRPFVYRVEAARYYDCSTTVSVIYRNAGCVDPNDLGHNGYGYTGTQWANGRWAPRPQVGDLAFYGYDSRGPYPSHVAIVISEALAWRLVTNPEQRRKLGRGLHVLTFGHDPVEIEMLRYRTDFRGCKAYVD